MPAVVTRGKYFKPGFYTWGQLAWLDTRVQNEKLHCNPPKGYYPRNEPRNNMAALNAMSNDNAEAKRLAEGLEMLDDTDNDKGGDE